MKILSVQHNANQATCSLSSADKSPIDGLFGKQSFNVSAIRARAGIVNFLLGIALVSQWFLPGSDTALYLSTFLFFDMLMAVFFGLTPLSPTGVMGTLLTFKSRPTPTYHLPKRFAWSMGASLSLIIITLLLTGANDSWVLLILTVFFALTWLDAVIGFCLGCWIYAKLFGCQSCRSD